MSSKQMYFSNLRYFLLSTRIIFLFSVAYMPTTSLYCILSICAVHVPSISTFKVLCFIILHNSFLLLKLTLYTFIFRVSAVLREGCHYHISLFKRNNVPVPSFPSVPSRSFNSSACGGARVTIRSRAQAYISSVLRRLFLLTPMPFF
ncbi:none [Leptomonas seymouri]|uniref:None n=1 Tax=Leptomonas seymouri TaxID=5684 RepID=A0A0N1PCR3_LEPSE|nr:none [Leptomonas seymouri]|eukprot:KPI85875.1 none [Leptomonas seymouri]